MKSKDKAVLYLGLSINKTKGLTISYFNLHPDMEGDGQIQISIKQAKKLANVLSTKIREVERSS